MNKIFNQSTCKQCLQDAVEVRSEIAKAHAETVRIPDTFAELAAELTSRKKQYNYYRNQLLSFPKRPLPTSPLPGGGEKIVKGSLPCEGEG